MERTKKAKIRRITGESIERTSDTLVVERDVAIQLHGNELIRTTCSPGQMHDWILGYLFSEGWITHAQDVAAIQETEEHFAVELAPAATGQRAPITPVSNRFAISADRLLEAAEEVACRAAIFAATGGTHAMGIFGPDGIARLAEDISRNCALEKVLGIALQESVAFQESFAFLSSRVPSRMVSKLARCGIPLIAAVSAPTHDAVRLAEKLNVCLCGFVRKDRWNAYTHGWRVGL